MYVCGLTVDNYPHIGHGRSALNYDVLRRYLLFNGLSVRYVVNITDIDDKIITRANEEGRTTQSVVDQYEGAWVEAQAGLGVLAPSESPHATAYVEDMVALVSDDRRCLPQRGSGGRVRPAGSPKPRLPPLRRPGGEHGREALTARFRPVEEGQAGGAHLAVTLGAGATGLAHRVCRDVARPAR
jgi:cysteinyl-tRNA synthetase